MATEEEEENMEEIDAEIIAYAADYLTAEPEDRKKN
jgi:hypothetical protein